MCLTLNLLTHLNKAAQLSASCLAVKDANS